MAKPALLAVDDDPDVLQAVLRDLQAQYAKQYRLLRADSGAAALELLRKLQERKDPVALLLVDQRMPQLSGTEFLGEAMKLYPDSKRVLLTAYADTDAAIQAINQSKVHYYLLKPWDPPQERLYPVLDDLLAEWQASYRPPFEGVRVIGHRWSPVSSQIKDFLARNGVPYRWLDAASSHEAEELVAQRGLERGRMPYVLLPDGSLLAQPTQLEVAQKVGLRTEAQSPFYDLVIVGAGPAGLAAAVYGASEGLRTVLVDSEAPGGQAGTSSRIENYLGFPSGLSGADLTRRAVTQAQKFGVEMLTARHVDKVTIGDGYRAVELGGAEAVRCHTLIVATGVSWNRLDAPGVERLTGAGIYYGAVATEAMSCGDEVTFVVGAGNSAGQGALYLAKYARSVTMLVRGDSLGKTMSQYLIDQIEATSNIHVRLRTQVTEAQGEERLEAITIQDAERSETVPADAMFVFIGATPRTDWLEGVVMRDRKGFVLTGPDLQVEGKRPPGWTPDRDPYLLETSVPCIFAAGDVRANSVKRVASAVGEGSIAVQFVHQCLASA